MFLQYVLQQVFCSFRLLPFGTKIADISSITDNAMKKYGAKCLLFGKNPAPRCGKFACV